MDSISRLPDHILLHLLSLVGIRTATKTSILSKKWRHLWTHIMDLDFDDHETTAAAVSLSSTNLSDLHPEPAIDSYVKLVNHVISANKAPYLNSFRINFPLNSFYAAVIENWIRFALGKNVRNLELNFWVLPRIRFYNIFQINPALIVNTTLESLRLESVIIDGPLFQWVLSNCPNLQHLSIYRCALSDKKSLKQKLVVSSLKLKHFEFMFSYTLFQAVQIIAPNLTSFDFHVNGIGVEFTSVPSIVDASFGWLSPHHTIYKLDILSGLSSQLKKLSLYYYEVDYASNQFPNFANVEQLEIVKIQDDGQFFPLIFLIQACPLLHTFKLKVNYTSTTKIEWSRTGLMRLDEEVFMNPITWSSTAPSGAQVNAICSQKYLEAVEYVGYLGSIYAAKFAFCLAEHAPKLNKFTFDPRPLQLSKVPVTDDYTDKMAFGRAYAKLLAPRIPGYVNVSIL